MVARLDAHENAVAVPFNPYWPPDNPAKIGPCSTATIARCSSPTTSALRGGTRRRLRRSADGEPLRRLGRVPRRQRAPAGSASRLARTLLASVHESRPLRRGGRGLRRRREERVNGGIGAFGTAVESGNVPPAGVGGRASLSARASPTWRRGERAEPASDKGKSRAREPRIRCPPPPRGRRRHGPGHPLNERRGSRNITRALDIVLRTPPRARCASSRRPFCPRDRCGGRWRLRAAGVDVRVVTMGEDAAMRPPRPSSGPSCAPRRARRRRAPGGGRAGLRAGRGTVPTPRR